MSKEPEQTRLTVEVKPTEDGRGMVLLIMGGLMTPNHALELSRMLAVAAFEADADAKGSKQ